MNIARLLAFLTLAFMCSLTPFAAHGQAPACGSLAEMPAFAIKGQTESGNDVTVAILAVPAECEPAFVAKLTANTRDPLAIVHGGRGQATGIVNTRAGANPLVTEVIVPDEGDTNASNHGTKGRLPARISTELKAGLYVSAVATGVITLSTYLSSDLSTTAAVFSLTGFLQLLNNVRPALMRDHFYGRAGRWAQWGASWLPESMNKPELAAASGKLVASALYNLVTTFAFQVAFNGTPGTWLGNTTTAGVGVVNGGFWEAFFSKITEKYKTPRVATAANAAKWTLMLIGASVCPFVFNPNTQGPARIFMLAVGTVGALAYVFDKPFTNAALKFLDLLGRAGQYIGFGKQAAEALIQSIPLHKGKIGAAYSCQRELTEPHPR